MVYQKIMASEELVDYSRSDCSIHLSICSIHLSAFGIRRTEVGSQNREATVIVSSLLHAWPLDICPVLIRCP